MEGVERVVEENRTMPHSKASFSFLKRRRFPASAWDTPTLCQAQGVRLVPRPSLVRQPPLDTTSTHFGCGQGHNPCKAKGLCGAESAAARLGDLGPAVADLSVDVHQEAFLVMRPALLVDVWPQLVVPSLAQLLPDAPLELWQQLAPAPHAVDLDQPGIATPHDSSAAFSAGRIQSHMPTARQ